MDTTPTHCDRNLSLLVQLARDLRTHNSGRAGTPTVASIAYCTSPNTEDVRAETNSSALTTETLGTLVKKLQKEMKEELLVGVKREDVDPTAQTLITNSFAKAIAVGLQLPFPILYNTCASRKISQSESVDVLVDHFDDHMELSVALAALGGLHLELASSFNADVAPGPGMATTTDGSLRYGVKLPPIVIAAGVGGIDTSFQWSQGSAGNSCDTDRYQLCMGGYEHIISTLLQHGADDAAIVFSRVSINKATEKHWCSFLSKYSRCTIVIDGFGLCATLAGAEPIDHGSVCICNSQQEPCMFNKCSTRRNFQYVFPSDAEIVATVVSMIAAGYVDQLALSSDIHCKLLLKEYGGPGYCYVDQVVVPALEESLESLGVSNVDKIIKKLRGENLLRLLQWRKKPVFVEKGPDYLTCYICKNDKVVVGQHLSKFKFNYCSGKCLAEHRKKSFS